MREFGREGAVYYIHLDHFTESRNSIFFKSYIGSKFEYFLNIQNTFLLKLLIKIFKLLIEIFIIILQIKIDFIVLILLL